MADAEVLFAAHRDAVFRYLSRIVGAGEASELPQEVFLRVARGPVPAADEPGRRAWIFTIARNLALNHVRDDHRRGTVVPVPDMGAVALPGARQLIFATSRTIRFGRSAGPPRDQVRARAGGSSRIVDRLPGPEEVLSFEMPPVELKEGAALPDQLSIRLRVTPL